MWKTNCLHEAVRRAINMSLMWCFSPQGRVWWEFPPFWGSVYPPLFTLFTHPNARGCQCGFTGSTWPVTTTRINLTSLWTMGDFFISWLHPVESMSTCRLCPDFKSEWPQKKGVERQLVQPLDFPADAVSSFDVGFLMSFFSASFHSFGVCDNKTFCNVQLDGVRDGNERKRPTNDYLLLCVMGITSFIHLAFATTSSYEMYNSVAYTTAPNKKHPKTPTCFYP